MKLQVVTKMRTGYVDVTKCIDVTKTKKKIKPIDTTTTNELYIGNIPVDLNINGFVRWVLQQSDGALKKMRFVANEHIFFAFAELDNRRRDMTGKLVTRIHAKIYKDRKLRCYRAATSTSVAPPLD